MITLKFVVIGCLLDRKTRVSSLQSLVCWYQEHCCSCPHEPLLRAVEPQPNFSTAAIWQCDSNHSFVQYLFSPISGLSDSEHEAEVNKDDGEIVSKILQPKESFSKRRRKEDHTHLKGARCFFVYLGILYLRFFCN